MGLSKAPGEIGLIEDDAPQEKHTAQNQRYAERKAEQLVNVSARLDAAMAPPLDYRCGERWHESTRVTFTSDLLISRSLFRKSAPSRRIRISLPAGAAQQKEAPRLARAPRRASSRVRRSI